MEVKVVAELDQDWEEVVDLIGGSPDADRMETAEFLDAFLASNGRMRLLNWQRTLVAILANLAFKEALIRLARKLED